MDGPGPPASHATPGGAPHSARGVSGVSERQGLNSSGKARQGSTGQGVPLDDAAAGSRAAAAAQVVEPVMEAGAQPGAMPSMLRELQRSHPGLPFGEEAPDIENGDLPSSEGLTIELPGSATLTASQWCGVWLNDIMPPLCTPGVECSTVG